MVTERAIEGVLLDVDGVLVSSWEALPGAVETVAWLRAEGVPFRLLTNTTVYSQAGLCDRLLGAGFDVRPEEVMTPVVTTAAWLKERLAGQPVFVLASEPAKVDLRRLGDVQLVDDPPAEAVVIGDAGDDGEDITYAELNRAFRLLIEGAEFIAMHRNLYWMTAEGLSLDVGAFVVGLEAASGVTATVMGKPSQQFFGAALTSLGVAAEHAIMLGDDAVNDVIGAHAAGVTGVLVRTGKFREDDLAKLAPGTNSIASIGELPSLLEDAGAAR